MQSVNLLLKTVKGEIEHFSIKCYSFVQSSMQSVNLLNNNVSRKIWTSYSQISKFVHDSMLPIFSNLNFISLTFQSITTT